MISAVAPLEPFVPKPAPVAPPKLNPIAVDEFLSKSFPARELLLSPWIPMKGLAMVYAPRGIGKTWVGLNVAWAIATGGSFLDWKAPKPRRVLYIDGEMPAIVLQERIATIAAAHGKDPQTPDAFRLLAADLEEFGIPNLSTLEGQAAVNAVLGDVDLIVIDNISTLCDSGRENDAESWVTVQKWLLDMRREGRSVLLIHHAGKGGAQRGTSKREDVLDTVVSLRRPYDYDAEQGARFEVHFEKARGFFGGDAEPFEASFSDETWTRKSLSNSRVESVLSLKADGMNQREIGKELGISAATVCRIIKKAEDGGGYGIRP